MKKKRAVGYRRRIPKSEKDFGNTSLEKQEDEIIKYCEMNGIELVVVYVNDLKSGNSLKGRIFYTTFRINNQHSHQLEINLRSRSEESI
ncbi:hypothetical protein JOC85_003075 [Bacillus mesophilus]|uniref:Recombinase family protein n=1 Tax=Bacillus mesophilus TaxID=1808955 RepID=A0A6M0QA12_9BACI|nr:recombinase family protein [Bacillus mesophilus]MBM7662268.1 hypothetical protein [Bacillus mesophilus]NEY73097.1 recombinase family protein [Bacillus mesophilus]